MSGPALKHLESHHAIHEAARADAKEATDVFEELLRQGDTVRALQAAYVLIEHWQTRTLNHAKSEEEGLYQEAVRVSPQLEVHVMALTRDHQLLRYLVDDISARLSSTGPSEDVLAYFRGLLWLESVHSREEEKCLVAVLEALNERKEQDDPHSSALSEGLSSVRGKTS